MPERLGCSALVSVLRVHSIKCAVDLFFWLARGRVLRWVCCLRVCHRDDRIGRPAWFNLALKGFSVPFLRNSRRRRSDLFVGLMRLDLRRKPEMHHVAVGDLVVLAFEPQLADVARAGLAAALDVILERDGLGADETTLKIRVDRAGGLRRARAFGHGPGARLLRTGGEERDEMQQPVAGADEAVEARLLQTDLGQEHLAL